MSDVRVDVPHENVHETGYYKPIQTQPAALPEPPGPSTITDATVNQLSLQEQNVAYASTNANVSKGAETDPSVNLQTTETENNSELGTH